MHGLARSLVGALFVALAIGPACGGGGGGGGDAPGSFTRVAYSLASLDGSVRSDGAWSATQSPLAGDVDADANGVGVAAYYSFDLSFLPPGSEILAATLGLYQTAHLGDPYARLDGLRATYAPYGGSLENAIGLLVFDAPPPSHLVGCYTECELTTDVMALLARALADGHSGLQVRVAFATPSDSNHITDAIGLTDGESAAHTPSLTVTWRDP